MSPKTQQRSAALDSVMGELARLFYLRRRTRYRAFLLGLLTGVALTLALLGGRW